jgi:hypothetical protein
VSVFLLNEETPRDPDRIEVPELVFQPEIRVLAGAGSQIVAVSATDGGAALLADPTSAQADDRSLELQYADRPGLARGHLCGAVWRDIDPQRAHANVVSPSEPPFFWIDGAIVPQAARQRFSTADVRTDLLPMYPVESPHMEWRAEFGPEPELDPNKLAEVWEPNDVQGALAPLTNRIWNMAATAAVAHIDIARGRSGSGGA